MLHLVVGTMKASKSSTLIDYTDLVKPKKYVIFYPSCCDKKDGYVVSRDNKEAKAVKIFEIKDMYNYVDNVDVIFIDEYTFFCNSSQVNEFMNFLEYCDQRDKQIYCFGLALDYMSQPFDITQRLLPYADTIVVLTAKCEICGNTATRCIRYVNGKLDNDPNSDTLLMENTNVEYKSVCKKCYREITGLKAIK